MTNEFGIYLNDGIKFKLLKSKQTNL